MKWRLLFGFLLTAGTLSADETMFGRPFGPARCGESTANAERGVGGPVLTPGMERAVCWVLARRMTAADPPSNGSPIAT